MNRHLIILVLGLSVAPACAEEPTPFLWSKPIPFEGGSGDELLTIPLDSDVYNATQSGLADIRIFDADRSAVPFLVRKSITWRHRVERRSWTARDVELTPQEDGTLVIRFRLRKGDPQPSGLKLVTSLRDFEQRVDVFENEETEALVTDALVYDYSRFMDVHRHDIPLPENSARTFRIRIGTPTAEQENELLELTRRLRGGEEVEREERSRVKRRPFRIERIELHAKTARSKVAAQASVSWPNVKMTSSENVDEKQTVLEVETRREPLTAFQLETEDRNFSRRVRVLVPEDADGEVSWREIASATLLRFRFRDVNRETLRVTFPEQRHEKYRIVVENRDSPPISFSGVSGEGPVHELVCLVASDAKLALHYGNSFAAGPSYDVAAIRAALDSGEETTVAKIGDATALDPDQVVAPYGATDIVNDPVVIGVVVSALVALLGFTLVRAGQRIDGLDTETKSDSGAV